MSIGELLQIEPLEELQFRFELKKQISCSMRLVNNSCNYVAFKVKTTDPKRYCVRPNTGVVIPNSSCNLEITMQAQKEAPKDMRCTDKFLVQSVTVNPGFTKEDIVTYGLFKQEWGNQVYERKLTVAYVTTDHHPLQPAMPDNGMFERVFSRVLQKLKRMNTSLIKSEYRSRDLVSSESDIGVYHQLAGKNDIPSAPPLLGCEAGLDHQCAKSIISETNDLSKNESHISDKDHYSGEDHCNPQSKKQTGFSDTYVSGRSSCQDLDYMCLNNNWNLPTYSVEPLDGKFLSKVTVGSNDLELSLKGGLRSSPGEAMDSAAAKMVAKISES